MTTGAPEGDIEILYEDNHLLAAIKPPNMPVQADSSRDMDMLTLLKRYVARAYDKPGKAYLGLVHRLDRPVGGAMVFARTSKAAARLSTQFASREADKRYYAVIEGEMPAETRMEDYLAHCERTGKARAARPGEPGAKAAALTCRPLLMRGGLTLCEIALETGRKHQIRAQCALRGLPIWGDARYGRARPGEQIALWARSLTVTHPTLKTRVTFACPPPNAGAWRAFEDILFGGS